MQKFVVTGIQMRNKGSQAMFLSLLQSLKSIDETHEVVGFSNKYENPDQYKFDILPYDDYTRGIFKYHLNRAPLLEPLITRAVGHWRKSDKWNGKVAEMDRALREADAIFDASGYTLGSGWSKQGGALLLQTIRIARRYRKKIILMPQSFGPFDWNDGDNRAFMKQVRKELSYCTKIYAREQEGYDCLTALGLNNVALSADMVIREKPFPHSSEICVRHDPSRVQYPPAGSVGFIVNENISRIGDAEAVTRLYAGILDKLVENGEQVYVVSTSCADDRLVERVLARVRDRSGICVISGEYSSPDLISIISRFKYIVASRYHSIVFGYRNGVPAIILGWATKYIDLAAHFGQQDYVFDIRDPGVCRMVAQIDRMSANHETESRLISSRLKAIQATSVVQQALDALNQRTVSQCAGKSPTAASGELQTSIRRDNAGSGELGHPVAGTNTASA